MTIHTETHWYPGEEEMYVAIQKEENVHIYFYESAESFAANEITREYQLPYEFLEEILRTRRPV